MMASRTPTASDLQRHPVVRRALEEAWKDSRPDVPEERHEEGGWIVAKFHTHPNPSSEGWMTRPSASDRAIDARHGVPDLILADDGIHVSGPEIRRGGLTGGPGYPPVEEA